MSQVSCHKEFNSIRVKRFRSSLLCIWCYFISITTASFSQQPYFKNYTTDDGLPSSEVHGIFQDELGYMWFSTDRGIARFDGKDFHVYNTDNGLPENCVLNFFVQSPRKVWLYTISHSVYSFDPLARSVSFQSYPELSDSLRMYLYKRDFRRSYVRSAHWFDDGSCKLSFMEAPSHIKIEKGGKIKVNQSNIYPDSFFNEGDLKLEVNFEGNRGNWHPTTNSFDSKDSSYGESGSLVVRSPFGKTFVDKRSPEEYGINLGMSGFLNIGDTIYFAQGKAVYKLTPNSLSKLVLNERILKIVLWKNKVLIGTYSGCISLDRDLSKTEVFFPDLIVSNIFVDHEGGLWLSTLQEGLFYQPSLTSQILSLSGYKSMAAVEIVQLQRHILVYNFNQSLSILPRDLHSEAKTINDVAYTNGLCRSSESSLAKLLMLLPNSSWDGYKTYCCGTELFPLVSWNSNTVSFLQKDSLKGAFLDVPRINDVQKVDTNRWILATIDGIYDLKFNEDGLLRTEFIGGSKISFTAISSDSGWIACATNDNGVYVYDGSLVEHITEAKGLLSDRVLDVEIANDTACWAATTKGLNYLVRKNGDFYSVATITRDHGLLSSEVTRLTICNDTLWIPNKKGVCFLDQRNVIGKDKMTPVYFRVDSMLVNGDMVDFNLQQPIVCGYGADIHIYAKQISFTNGSTLGYRYRLSNDEPWQQSDDGHVFINEADYGEFTLEIQAYTSNTNFTSMKISLAVSKPMWLWPEFYLGLILVMSLAVFTIYRILLRQLKRRRDKEYERIQLEIRSIVSQMNPHFTFNTINSIQSYIIQHGTREAVLYLADFAVLIRKTLDYSRQDFISLQDELEFLRLYIGLENKRFQNEIVFSESLALTTAANQIKWPPLILQPLIENSIVHALSNKRGGRIDLIIEEHADYFKVIVKDNGGAKESVDSKKMKSSVGLDIVGDRIRLHNGISFSAIDFEYGMYNADTESGWQTTIKLVK